NVADDLPLLHGCSVADALGESLHMRVERAVAIAMLNDYGVAVSAFAASEKHFTVTRALDRGTVWGGIVHAFMSPDFVQNRMFAAVRKTGADAREIHRRSNKGLAHVVAISRVIAAGALLISVANRCITFAAVGKASSENVSGSYLLARNGLLLIDHLEGVAFTYIHGEIDVVAEHVGQIHRQIVAEARAFRGEE